MPSIAEACANLLDQSQPLFDLLISLLDHEDHQIRELALELYAQRVYRAYLIESMETMSFNDIFAKTFQFKSPVVDALASYDDLANLLRRNSSDSSLNLGEHNSEESSDDQETVDKPPPKPVERYQKTSPDFERHGAIVRIMNLESFQNAFTDVMTLFPLAKKTLSVRKDPLVNVLYVILVDEHSEEGNLLEQAEAFLKVVDQNLRSHNIRRVALNYAAAKHREHLGPQR
ncbi:hypothetical protein P3T76_013740 [Phytophthora citrophthora]|uniref:Acetyl-CoA carboxylase central domain-containing protein n=1 Tax=Phytophthora citrophthora TaxID=4793 RepID=A0AAD9G2N8_9STRA|nr:hypothetical protein P3T76_013740 [Phytophthora citrophthora]